MTGPSANEPGPKRVTQREHRLWAVAIVILGLWLPGAGLMLAMLLSLTRLQKSPPKTLWGLIALGGALMLIDYRPFGDSSSFVPTE